MKDFFKKRRPEIIIFFISLALSMAGFCIRSAALPQNINDGTKFFYTSDSRDYLNVMKNLIERRSLSTFPASLGLPVDAFRPPGYPIFLALLHYINQDVRFFIIIQNIISAFAAVLVYLIGKKFFSKKAGFLAALLFAFESERLHTSNAIMSDILASFLFFISLAVFLEFYKKKKIIYLAASGIFLGVSTLTRPATQAIVLIFILFIILINLKELRKKKVYLAKAIAVLFFSYILVVLPWSIRNYVQFKDWRLSPELGFSIYNYATVPFLESSFFPDKEYLNKLEKEKENFNDNEIMMTVKKYDDFFIENKFTPLFYLKALRDLNFNFSASDEMRPWEQRLLMWSFGADNYFTEKSMAIIMKYPFHFAAFYAKNTFVAATISAAAFIYDGFDTGEKIPANVYFPGLYFAGKIVWMIYYLFIISSFFNFFWKKTKEEKAVYLLFCAIILYFSIFLSLGGSPSRYRIPANPLIFILFAVTFFDFIEYFKKKYRKNVTAE